MFHNEIYAEVARLLKLRDDTGRYRLLDLGCGNARYLAPCLRQSPPALYEGVDLSEAALIEARGYLADLPDCSVTLTHGDLLTAVQSTGKTWDVIFTGFAVHHLTSADKAHFFEAAGRCLSEQGWLILVDVVREENQSRADYLQGYLKCMRDTWVKVPPDQLEEACTHVHDHDYPSLCLHKKSPVRGFFIRQSELPYRNLIIDFLNAIDHPDVHVHLGHLLFIADGTRQSNQSIVDLDFDIGTA